LTKFVISTALVFLCCIKLAIAAPGVQLDPASCVTAGHSYDVIGEKLIGANWVHYQNFMKICPVDALPGKPALFVYALDVNNPDAVAYTNGKPFDMVNDLGPPTHFHCRD